MVCVCAKLDLFAYPSSLPLPMEFNPNNILLYRIELQSVFICMESVVVNYNIPISVCFQSVSVPVSAFSGLGT